MQKGVGLVSGGRSQPLFKDWKSIIEDWGRVVFKYVFKQNNNNKKYLLILQNAWFFKWNSPKPLSLGPAVLIFECMRGVRWEAEEGFVSITNA